jgi:hypothetical protein
VSDEVVVTLDASSAVEICELLRWLIELCEDDGEGLGPAMWRQVGRGYPRAGLRRDLMRLTLAFAAGASR